MFEITDYFLEYYSIDNSIVICGIKMNTQFTTIITANICCKN